MLNTLVALLSKIRGKTVGFFSRQSRNFKVILIRRPIQAIAMGLSAQYNSIYATALGANPIQLGSLSSAGNAIGAITSLPAGWLIDRYSLKMVFLAGTVLMAVSCSLYFFASNWVYLYAAVVLLTMGSRITCTACTVTCANELANEERATGRGVCRTMSSFAALLTPIGAAKLISVFGGISIKGLRPLYAVQFIIFAAIFTLLVLFFRDSRAERKDPGKRNVLRGFLDVFKQGPDVIRIMFMIAIMELPWSMAQPFLPLYAHQYKAADEFLLGAMASARTLVPMIFSILIGRLADRRGRKKLLFAIAPFAYLGSLCLIFAKGPLMLLASGFFFGFNSISMALATAMSSEIMPKKQMGRWIGIVSLVRGLVAIPAPMLGGFIWDHLGPLYVFVGVIVLDLLIRLPLLSSVRETLTLGNDLDKQCTVD